MSDKPLADRVTDELAALGMTEEALVSARRIMLMRDKIVRALMEDDGSMRVSTYEMGQVLLGALAELTSLAISQHPPEDRHRLGRQACQGHHEMLDMAYRSFAETRT